MAEMLAKQARRRDDTNRTDISGHSLTTFRNRLLSSCTYAIRKSEMR
jgi:hypothetical protein